MGKGEEEKVARRATVTQSLPSVKAKPERDMLCGKRGVEGKCHSMGLLGNEGQKLLLIIIMMMIIHFAKHCNRWRRCKPALLMQ